MEPFIDTHAHLIRGIDWSLMEEIAASGVLRQAWIMHVPCSEDGIRFADEDEVLELARRFPGLFIPFGFIDFAKGAEEVARLHDRGFRGLKALSPLKPYDDESHFPVFRKAEELGMPILFHVGIISKGLWHQMEVPGFPGPRNMKPSMLDTIADAFPGLQLIQGHLGIPWIDELSESLFCYPNIRCSVCGLIDYEWLIRSMDRRTCRGEAYVTRLMFGSDNLYGRRAEWRNVLESAGFMEGFFRHVGRTRRWGENRRDFMAENAAPLFAGIDG